MASCRCECGYTCGRQCDLDIMECINEHYVKDCDHEWGGWEPHYNINPKTGEEYESGGSKVCTHCGLSAMQHDMAVGP